MTKNMVEWSNQMDPTKWVVNEIEIPQFPNSNQAYVLVKRHEERMRLTGTVHGCLNRFEIKMRWGMPLDAIDKQSLHACLDEWIKDREQEMAESAGIEPAHP